MKQTTSLTFNIIYVPGAVQYLRLAVLSLLNNSDCTFRLIANGCSESERLFLEDLCRQHPQLEYLSASESRVIPHGELLSTLQLEEKSRYFAFMDSDIFASADFMAELSPYMESTDALFSCPPIWSTEELQTLPSGHRILDGVLNRFTDGTCVGTSYFAVYDNAILTECMKETGVTLRGYRWKQIPPLVKEELQESNKAVEHYDTGKLINILLGLRGYRCHYQPLDSLCHLGGISVTKLRTKFGTFLSRLSPYMPTMLFKFLQFAGLYNGGRDMWSHEELEFLQVMATRRRPSCFHFSAYLKYLAGDASKPPPFKHKSAQLVSRVEETEELLSDLHSRYGENALGTTSREADLKSKKANSGITN